MYTIYIYIYIPWIWKLCEIITDRQTIILFGIFFFRVPAEEAQPQAVSPFVLRHAESAPWILEDGLEMWMFHDGNMCAYDIYIYIIQHI